MIWKISLTPRQLEKFGREREKKAYQAYVGRQRVEETNEACRTGVSPWRKSWAAATINLWEK